MRGRGWYGYMSEWTGKLGAPTTNQANRGSLSAQRHHRSGPFCERNAQRDGQSERPEYTMQPPKNSLQCQLELLIDSRYTHVEAGSRSDGDGVRVRVDTSAPRLPRWDVNALCQLPSHITSSIEENTNATHFVNTAAAIQHQALLNT